MRCLGELLSATLPLVMASTLAAATEIDSDLVGWTVIAVTKVQDDSGGGLERIVVLQNGMVLKLTGIGLPALPYSSAVVFGKKVTADEIAKSGVKGAEKLFPNGMIMFKLMLGDHVYSAVLLK